MTLERIKELPHLIDRIRKLIYLMEEINRRREPEISTAAANEVRQHLIIALRVLRAEKRKDDYSIESAKV